jgi:hypothetical protein
MNRNPLLASISWRIILSVLLVAVLSLAVVPLNSQASRRPAAFPAPVPLNPPDQLTTVTNYPPRAVPYFEWAPVSGATRYQIQIAQDIAFTQIRYDVVTANTRYLPANDDSFPDGDVYWRVRVHEPSAGDWPLIPWHFMRNWATNNAPSLTSPASGEVLRFFETPTFSWTPAVGAAYYRLAIDNDSNCQSPLYQYDTGETTYNPYNRVSNGTYYWMVRAYDRANHEGGLSECRSFTMQYDLVTTLLQPANSSFPVYTPQFKWTAVKGAVAYWLYYSTDSTFQSGVVSVRTTQTTFTPRESLPNDINYFWKVRVEYPGGYLGPDSDVWTFQKRWYHQPIILTPINSSEVNPALFTWTPVREAARYVIEASFDSGFSTIRWSDTTPNTFYWRNGFDVDEWGRTEFVRVRPMDNGSNNGKNSNPISFRPVFAKAYAEHIFPRYYYPPPSIVSGNYTAPYNIPVSYDYTVNVPTFYWSRVFVPGETPRVEASRYRLQVDDDPNFGSPNWTYETENLSATPADGVPFVPISTTVYYWHVTPLAAAGTALISSTTNQPWAVHIDTSRLPSPVGAMTLQRPPQGEKTMDTLPSFEWSPLSGAVRYELAISTRADFAATAYVTRTIYTHHTPNVRLPKDTYFWRVRGLNGAGQQVGAWSEIRRMIVAYDTRWTCNQTAYGYHLPTMWNTLLATDGVDGGSTDLTTLYSSQDANYWYIGFNYSPSVSGQVTYTLYLDGNQADNQGANVAPPNRPAVTTVNYYRPEYAINVHYNDTQFDTNWVDLFSWDQIGGTWNLLIKNLVDSSQVGGSIYIDGTTNYVELKIPKTAIGDLGTDPFMLSMALFSTTSNAATSVSDSVPDNGAGASVLAVLVSIADRVNLAVPAADSALGPTPVSYTPYLYAETGNTDWLRGFRLQVSRDALFTSVMDTVEHICTGCEYYIDIFQYLYTPIRIYEDNTLYWRYWVKHNDHGSPDLTCKDQDRLAPPSEAHVFTKLGPVPSNLQTASQYSTPTFKWNDVETAAYYQIQVASNPNFSGNIVDESINHDNFTPSFPIAPGKYYWRVRSLNGTGGGYASAWSVSSTVNITLPMVTLLEPASGASIHSTPTFKWQSVLTPTNQPEWAGAAYRLQVADSPNGFTAPYRDYIVDSITLTPSDAFPNKTYYWRVAVRDTSGNEGPYSRVFTFTKQYPKTTLVEPIVGGQSGGFPTFKWTALTGAATYHIQIARNLQFTQLVRDEYADNLWYVLLEPLPDASYYWRVAMVDRYGNHGPYNDATLIVSIYPYHVYLPAIRK